MCIQDSPVCSMCCLHSLCPQPSRHPAQNDYAGSTYTTFKLPNLALTRVDVGSGLDLCITLIEPCASLPDFCYGGAGGACRTTLFSTDEACCPTGDTDVSHPGGGEGIDTAFAPPAVEVSKQVGEVG